MGFLKQPKKCFVCDSRKKADSAQNGFKESHRLKYIISDEVGDKLSTWWQAESGKENVYIQVSLKLFTFNFSCICLSCMEDRSSSIWLKAHLDASVPTLSCFECKHSKIENLKKRSSGHMTDLFLLCILVSFLYSKLCSVFFISDIVRDAGAGGRSNSQVEILTSL